MRKWIIFIFLTTCMAGAGYAWEIPAEMKKYLDNYTKDSTAKWGPLDFKKRGIISDSVQIKDLRLRALKVYNFKNISINDYPDTVALDEIIESSGFWFVLVMVRDKPLYELRLDNRTGKPEFVSAASPAAGSDFGNALWAPLLKMYPKPTGADPVLLLSTSVCSNPGGDKFLYFKEKGPRKIYYGNERGYNYQLDSRFTASIEILDDSRKLIEYLKDCANNRYATIMTAISTAKPGQAIRIAGDKIYEEQVTINKNQEWISLRSLSSSAPSGSKPQIKFFIKKSNAAPQKHANPNLPNVNLEAIIDVSALRIFGGALGVLIDGIDIEGENAVYNTGNVAIRNGMVSATSYHAVYNTGDAQISNTKVSALSGYAVYNTGRLQITNGAVLAASDTAIYNYGGSGELFLFGSPVITGRIAGFGAGRVSLVTTNPNAFAPNNNKYLLAPDNLKNGDIVVTLGAGFIGNFKLADPNFILAVKGKDLIAVPAPR